MHLRLRFRQRYPDILACSLVALLSGALTACDGRDEPKQSVAEQPTQDIDFAANTFDLLVDDVDANGLPDVLLTSHTASFTQVFYQRAPRVLEPGEPITEVGFHPGNLIRLGDRGDGRRLYLMSAEGINRFLVFEPDDRGELKLINQSQIEAPRYTVEMSWPGSGLGVAVAPFVQAWLPVLEGFDPLAGSAAQVNLLKRKQTSRFDRMVAADLTADGYDELVFLDNSDQTLGLIRPPAAGEKPVLETLWKPEFGYTLGAPIVADLDRDGDLDIFSTRSWNLRAPPSVKVDTPAEPVIQVLINQGAGQFVAGPVIDLPDSSSRDGPIRGLSALVHARESDGVDYLALSSSSDLVLFRWRPGDPLERPAILAVPSARPGAVGGPVVLVDLDQDGSLDLVGGRSGGARGGFVLYGPLWRTFESLVASGVVLGTPREAAERGS